MFLPLEKSLCMIEINDVIVVTDLWFRTTNILRRNFQQGSVRKLFEINVCCWRKTLHSLIYGPNNVVIIILISQGQKCNKFIWVKFYLNLIKTTTFLSCVMGLWFSVVFSMKISIFMEIYFCFWKYFFLTHFLQQNYWNCTNKWVTWDDNYFWW